MGNNLLEMKMNSTYKFSENLDTEMYLKILTDMLPEMRSITDENIVIQIDNAKVYWSIIH